MILDKLTDEIRARSLPVYAVAAASCEDDIRVERCFPGNLCNNLYSVSKNFTATAVGMLADRGKLSLEDDVWSLLHGMNPDMPQEWKNVTVRHVLTQTIGTDRGFLDVDVEDTALYPTQDYLKMVLEHPFSHAPGEHFRYSDSNYYLASRIVHAASGERLFDFLQRELFNPLAFTAPAWACCPQGHAMGATGLFCSVQDMIKLGILYANGGVWRGQRLLSEAWVQEASRPYAEDRYGLSFWTSEQNAWYNCGGMFGQKIFIPRKPGREVIAWAAYDTNQATAPLVSMVEAYYRGE
ncbi:MAG: serine hydrolase [Ruminococcaceae bacterium]|nr:serine hydrolase [Oscillospiraceae bacterium]